MLRRFLRLGVPALHKLRCQQKPAQVQFDEMLRSLLRPYHIVLDAGCGTVNTAALRGDCQMVVGIDRDVRTSSNPQVDALVRGDLSRLPFRDRTFNVIMSSWVIEHLDDPQTCFEEFARVCKDGALCVLVTPNLLHYVNLLVRLTPFGFHNWFLLRILGSKAESYPTRYRANTPHKLERMMKSAGFTTVEVRCIDGGPVYLDWLTPGFAVGLIYHRLVNRFEKLSFLRATIIGAFRR